MRKNVAIKEANINIVYSYMLFQSAVMGDSDLIVLNLVMVVSTTHVAALMVYVFMLIDVNLAMNTEDIAIKVGFSH